MIQAFILINAEIGMEKDVLKQIKKIKEVKKANLVYGVYDIVIEIYADSMSELKRIVFEKIRTLDMVTSTNTMVIMNTET